MTPLCGGFRTRHGQCPEKLCGSNLTGGATTTPVPTRPVDIGGAEVKALLPNFREQVSVHQKIPTGLPSCENGSDSAGPPGLEADFLNGPRPPAGGLNISLQAGELLSSSHQEP